MQQQQLNMLQRNISCLVCAETCSKINQPLLDLDLIKFCLLFDSHRLSDWLTGISRLCAWACMSRVSRVSASVLHQVAVQLAVAKVDYGDGDGDGDDDNQLWSAIVVLVKVQNRHTKSLINGCFCLFGNWSYLVDLQTIFRGHLLLHCADHSVPFKLASKFTWKKIKIALKWQFAKTTAKTVSLSSNVLFMQKLW